MFLDIFQYQLKAIDKYQYSIVITIQFDLAQTDVITVRLAAIQKVKIALNDITCNDEIFLNAINEQRLNITMYNVIYET